MSDHPLSVETLLGMVAGEDPALGAIARQMAALLADPRSLSADARPVTMTRRQATVIAVDLGPPLTATVELNGVPIPGASPQRTYRPIVGDEVWLEFHGTEAHISPPVTSDANFRWNALALAGAWVTYSLWAVPAQYHRDAAGWVNLRGAISSGAAASNITTMPAGFRPPVGYSGHSVTVLVSPTVREAGLITISATTGAVDYQGPATPYFVPLDGIRFRID